MRLGFSALITGTVLAVSSLSHAAPSPQSATVKSNSTGPTTTSGHPVSNATPAPITVDALAQVTAILSYCSQVDRPDAGKYAAALASILSGHAAAEIKVVEASPLYGAGARNINLQLASLPVSTVVSACKNFLAGK